MAKFQSTHKVTTKSGIEQEESLLTESAARETSLNSQIIDLETEAKQVSSINPNQGTISLFRFEFTASP